MEGWRDVYDQTLLTQDAGTLSGIAANTDVTVVPWGGQEVIRLVSCLEALN